MRTSGLINLNLLFSMAVHWEDQKDLQAALIRG